MAYSIQYIYQIADKFSAPIQKMKTAASQFDKKILKSEKSLQFMGEQSDKARKRVNNLGQSLKTGFSNAVKVGVVGSLAIGTMAVTSFIKEASKIEDATAAFTPLMGGVEKANELVDALNKTAASTPFQFENISAASKQLLPVMNQDINKTVETFRMLGDTAGGNAQKLDSITRGYTKAMLKGKVDMESLNMIAEAGVPIYSELSASMGVSVKEMMKMSSAGTITSNDLTKAFQNMTGEGGIFYKGMEIASQTLSGKMSTLKDNISLTSAAIGMQLLPTIKPLIDKAIKVAQTVKEWVTANQELINQKLQTFITNLVATLTTTFNIISKVYNVIVTILPFLKTIAPLVLGIAAAWAIFNTAMNIATVVQMALNSAMLSNPIGLIITAVGLLAGGIYLLVQNWDKVKEVMGMVWEKMKGFAQFMGKAFLTALLAPTNLIIESIQKLLTLMSKIPGLGSKMQPALDSLQGFQDKMNQNTLMANTGGANTPYLTSTPQAPMPTIGSGANANANATVSVYTEKGMKAEPWTPSGNLGYQMQNSYQRGM